MMQYKCIQCGTINDVPKGESPKKYACYACRASLPSTPESHGELSGAVGLIGGTTLGASIGGPVGAIIGGILGSLIGKEAKGVG